MDFFTDVFDAGFDHYKNQTAKTKQETWISLGFQI